jgi:hypothetical protein
MIRVANSFSIQNVNMTILDVAVFLSQAVTDKVTAVLLPPCRCQGGEDVLFLLILDLSTRWGESGQHHAHPILLIISGK